MGVKTSGDIKYQKDIILRREVVKHNTNIRICLKTHGKEVKNKLVKVTSTGPRSGRVYTYRGVKYQASARGEAPAKREGRLSGGFLYKSRPLELLIANKSFSRQGFNYVRHLEEKMDRPFFVNTIESLSMKLKAELSFLKR